MHRNQFAPLKEEAGSPMSSVISVTAPTELGATVELAKPEKEWMDLQSWTLPPAAISFLMLGEQNSTVANLPC